MLDFYKNRLKEEGCIYLLCKIFPSSQETKIKEFKKSNIDGRDVDMIFLSVTASPVKNKANNEIIRFMSKEFNVAKNNVVIISGGIDRLKLIKIKK